MASQKIIHHISASCCFFHLKFNITIHRENISWIASKWRCKKKEDEEEEENQHKHKIHSIDENEGFVFQSLVEHTHFITDQISWTSILFLLFSLSNESLKNLNDDFCDNQPKKKHTHTRLNFYSSVIFTCSFAIT